jgi:hypothetical protein
MPPELAADLDEIHEKLGMTGTEFMRRMTEAGIAYYRKHKDLPFPAVVCKNSDATAGNYFQDHSMEIAEGLRALGTLISGSDSDLRKLLVKLKVRQAIHSGGLDSQNRKKTG